MAVSSPWDDDPLHAPAFWAFVRFASGNLMDEYVADCGEPNIAVGGIEAMIDEATGHRDAELQKFVDWCLLQYGTPEDVYGSE